MSMRRAFSERSVVQKPDFQNTLNYTPNYTWHPKLSERTISTLKYNSCYTLHLVVNSIAILDGKSKFMG